MRCYSSGYVTVATTLGLIVATPAIADSFPLRSANTDETQAAITRLSVSILAGSQLSHRPLDKQLASRLLDRYLEMLDPNRVLFLQSDVEEFSRHNDAFTEAIRIDGDIQYARMIFDRYVTRLDQQVTYDENLLRTRDFNFTTRDIYIIDRARALRPRNTGDARRIWRQQLRAEYLDEKLSNTSAPPAQITARLILRHARHLQHVTAVNEGDFLEAFLDTLAHVYDPHSDYLGRQAMENLSIAMDLSLVGVGASLADQEGACTIGEVVAGSPAARSGKLRPGSRIVAVAEGAGAPVDVSDMPLMRVVKLIRGPKGTAVTLTVLPPAGSAGQPEAVTLVRADIKLDEQRAKGWIFDVPEDGGRTMRLGLIDLDSFYSDGGHDGHGGAAADVAGLLTEMKANHVQGVVLDLRRNGGGSVTEAIRLTGLFIKAGPIVQTRGFENEVRVAEDPDPTAAYDGPLVLLTSRFTASAAEITAGALQDYGRAVIVGDSVTFGKGTVQDLVTLAPVMDRLGLSYAFEPGALKLTVAQFYRPSGSSVELRGVTADVVLPSTSDFPTVSEAQLDDPVPSDAIPPTPFDHDDRVAAFLPTLRALSARRLDEDPAFAALRAEAHHVKMRSASRAVSLNETQRRLDIADSKVRMQAIAQRARVLSNSFTGFPLTDAHRPASAQDMFGVSPEDDIILNESLLVLGDYVRLVTPGYRPEKQLEGVLSRSLAR